MSLMAQSARLQHSSQARPGAACCSTSRPRRTLVRASASGQCEARGELASASVDRRSLLLAAAGAASLLGSGPARADAEPAEFATFLGYATPPTSYGGYGGNANEVPKYSFEYPLGWKSEVPSKVEKGTQGVDGRVVNPRSKDTRAFVITLGRAGEDNKTFRLTDTDATFSGFAGADYNLQDAMSSASNIGKQEVQVDGTTFFQYDIDSPEFRYLSSIAVKNGKVFALFVRSPTKAFAKNEAQLRHIMDTFRLL